jgi:signal transduction histidine kinase
MAFYYATALLTAITSLILGLFVFLKNPHNKLHISLFRLNAVVSLWSVFLFLHYSSKTYSHAMLTLYVLHSAVIFIPACYIHLISDLLELKQGYRIKISYAICTILLPFIYTPYFISGVKEKLIFRFYADAGPLYIYWIIAYAVMASYGIYLMVSHYTSSSLIKKIQIRYVLAASLIGFAGGATIYPLFYDIPILPFGEHVIFLYPIIFSIAVLKYDALQLNIAIKRTIVYSLSIALITIVYLVIVLISERLLAGMMGYQSLGITVAAAVIIALIFSPLKNRVEKFVEKLYIKNAYQRMQKELIESDKSKALAQLAAGLAHEIRNPLTAIKTFCEYLPKKYNDKSFRDDFSRIVNFETEKINTLIGRLLEFSKPSIMKIAPCDVHEALDYTLNLLSAETLKFKIKIIKNYVKKNHEIYADSVKLKHVFFNLIKNSIEALNKGGTITISTNCAKNRFNIEIKDDGCGICKKDLVRIFEPFFSLKDKGAGLGLSVVQSIISDHNGTVFATSAPGAGTMFTVSLPIAPNPISGATDTQTAES